LVGGKMMTKTLCVVVVLCVFATNLFAQTETALPILTSKPVVGYTPFVKPVLTCQCFKIDSPPKKRGPVLSLDIPLSPSWDMVQEERIKNHTIQFGQSGTSWKETSRSKGWPLPRINFTSSSFRMSAEGGVIKTQGANLSRTMTQARVSLEGSLWFVLVGADGFVGQEQIPGIMKGVNFDADFLRSSYGGQSWWGIKLGDFNRNFIVGRYGRGYVRTDGEIRFIVPSITEDLDWFSEYLEEFKTESASVEGKVKTKWMGQSVRVDWMKYSKVVPSPDPLRFGENYLEDMWLRTETEVMPLSHLGVVVALTKDFRGQNRLMFINDYSSVRVFIRLAF